VEVCVQHLIKIPGWFSLRPPLAQQERSTSEVGDRTERIRCPLHEASRRLRIAASYHSDQQGIALHAGLQELIAQLLNLPSARHSSCDPAASAQHVLRHADAKLVGRARQQQDYGRIRHQALCR
jgi:hypothetical protein